MIEQRGGRLISGCAGNGALFAVASCMFCSWWRKVSPAYRLLWMSTVVAAICRPCCSDEAVRAGEQALQDNGGSQESHERAKHARMSVCIGYRSSMLETDPVIPVAPLLHPAAPSPCGTLSRAPPAGFGSH